MAASLQKNLFGLSIQQLTEVATDLGQPRFRGGQLFQAIYREAQTDLSAVTTLPVAFREQLAAAGYFIALPTIEKRFTSLDGTIRCLLGLADGQTVETVWMPEGDGGEAGEDDGGGDRRSWSRATICISSQVGCAVNCQFCMTALLGMQRNLTAGEIVGQVMVLLKDRKVEMERDRINLVFMGQGEPFLNYDNFMQAVRILAEGVGVPQTRMTVSTSGIVPRIRDFAGQAVRPRLAISLNGSNDVVRERVMPINRKWDLQALLDAVRDFPLRPRERVTFEYVLLADVNDSPQNAREVVRLLNGIRAKVNLIAFNPGPEIPFSTPSEERVLEFQRVLTEAGVPAFIRRPRGRDIYAACGQLKKAAEAELVGIK